MELGVLTLPASLVTTACRPALVAGGHVGLGVTGAVLGDLFGAAPVTASSHP